MCNSSKKDSFHFKLTAPQFLAETFVRFRASAMCAARIRYALAALRPLPAGIASDMESVDFKSR